MPQVGKVAIRCKDLAKSAAFYRDVLGLKEFVLPGMQPDRVRFFNAGLTNLELILAGPDDKPQEVDGHVGINHFAFTVKDIQKVAADLRQKGVKILTEPREAVGGILYAFIEDPNGMRVELLEFTKGQPWLDS